MDPFLPFAHGRCWLLRISASRKWRQQPYLWTGNRAIPDTRFLPWNMLWWLGEAISLRYLRLALCSTSTSTRSEVRPDATGETSGPAAVQVLSREMMDLSDCVNGGQISPDFAVTEVLAAVDREKCQKFLSP